MKRIALALVLFVFSFSQLAAQDVPFGPSSAASPARKHSAGPNSFENNDMGMHITGAYPYIQFDPGNSSAATDGWSSCYIQMNVTETDGANGPFMLFKISDGKKFYFNQDVDIKGKLAIGVTAAATDLDVVRYSPTNSVAGRFLNVANTSDAAANLQLQVGDGTASSKKAFVSYYANEGATNARSWKSGMIGTTDFIISDHGGVARMTITQPDAAGNSTITFNGTVNGGVIHANYQDVAEWVPASEELAPGTVVVLNAARPNEVMKSGHAYDTKAAGVVSARPGVILGQSGAGKAQIATTGRVRVKVDATTTPIQIGDLLVTSDKPGMAMKSTPVDIGGISIHRPGTVIGKALEPLQGKTGEILVLLTLQ